MNSKDDLKKYCQSKSILSSFEFLESCNNGADINKIIKLYQTYQNEYYISGYPLVAFLNTQTTEDTLIELHIKKIVGTLFNVFENKSYLMESSQLNNQYVKYEYDFTGCIIECVIKESVQENFYKNILSIKKNAPVYLKIDTFDRVSTVESISIFEVEHEISFDDFLNLVTKKFNNNYRFEKGYTKYLKHWFNLQQNKTPNLIYSLEKYIVENLSEEECSSCSAGNVVTIKNSIFHDANEDKESEELTSLLELSELIGMKPVKDKVEELVAYLEFNEHLKKRTGTTFPLTLHMCLTGDPGTGKTTVARIIAKLLYDLEYVETDKFIEVDKQHLIAEYVGQTAIKTANVLKEARGGVLFIDEAYSISEDKYGGDAIATLIKYMEDHRDSIVVIFAGYKDEMDKFIDSNPGIKSRLGYNIHFENYSEEELVDILKYKIKKYKLEVSEDIFEDIFKVVSIGKEIKNFGNGRFMDRLLQDILLQHSLNVKGKPVNDDYFLLDKQDIPKKYL